MPRGPPDQFEFIRPERYYGIVSRLPLPVILSPNALLHPVAQYPALLQELSHLVGLPRVNPQRVAPVRAFLAECVARGPNALPDSALYCRHPGVLSSASICIVYLLARVQSSPEASDPPGLSRLIVLIPTQAWPTILTAVLHLFWLHSGRALVNMSSLRKPERAKVIVEMRAALYPVQKVLHHLYDQRHTDHFKAAWEEAAELVLGALFSMVLVHSYDEPLLARYQANITMHRRNVQEIDQPRKPDLVRFFEALSTPDGREGFLGILYTTFWKYPRPHAAETFEVFPYVVPAEALAGSAVMRVQFDALEDLVNSEAIGPLTNDEPFLQRLPRSHIFSFRPLHTFWRHVVHRCWRAGCPQEHEIGKMRQCGGCQRAFYCSKECQRTYVNPL